MKLNSCILVSTIFFVGLGCIFYADLPSAKYTVTTAQFLRIYPRATHIALLGCTPHPTAYLRKQGAHLSLLENIRLEDFLDIPYLQDSFHTTFIRCKEQAVDQLIIAYLPIYYMEMRTLLGVEFITGCHLFFKQLAPSIMQLIKMNAEAVGYDGTVTLIFPTDEQLNRVPSALDETEDRYRYLVKQFPRLHNLERSSVNTISIINNQASVEDDELIRYFKYEYLFEKRVAYKKMNIGKERFHKYA
jgi:hypothetical protein